MNKRSWITFTVVRLLAFFVPLLALLFMQVNPWIATLIAAVIGLCVSYIFLRRPREEVARELYEVRHAEKPTARADDEAEDAALDAQHVTDTGSDKN